MKETECPDEWIPTRKSLLTRLKSWDDQEGWQEFFNTYWRLIYGVARQAGLGDAEAQEVVQLTVIAVADKMKSGEFKYDPKRGSFKAWLLTQTQWRVSDQFRKRRQHDEGPIRSTTQVPLGQWALVATTWNGTNLSYFLDGNPIGTFPFAATMFDPSPGTRRADIGVDDQEVGFIHGALDDVRVYNRALTAAQIQELYHVEGVPWVVAAPASQVVSPTANVGFSVVASGSEPLSYQWSSNGIPMAGQTSSILNLPNVS